MPEYAPEYTKRERVFLVLKHAAWAVPLFLITKFWFFPWFEAYITTAHCINYGVFTGSHIVFYSLFIGLPLLLAIVILLIEGPRSLKIIKIGQNPLPNEKVLSKKKYTYGNKAKIKPVLFFMATLVLLGMAFKGFFWANNIISKQNNNPPPCIGEVKGHN